MKKIIYSLVIMIAAGSLFTSCVENTEPQGIKDLRLAKADYLDALSNLRAADAEKVKAEATLVQAQAATEQAQAALKQAYVKAQELANEAAALDNEKKAAQIAADIDSIIAKAEQDAVDAQKTLAEKQAALDSALRRIAAKSIGLTQDEKDAIDEATGNLNIAYGNYNWALAGFNAAQYQLWETEYNVAAGYKGFETADSYRDSIGYEEYVISLKEENIATLKAIKLAPEFAKDSIEANNAKIKVLEGEKLAAEADIKLYEATTLYEANKAYGEKVDAAVAKLPKEAKFEFADKDGKQVKYALTNGKGLDETFGIYVNEAIKDAKGKAAKDYGISVDEEFKNILVGGKGVSEKQLDSAQAILATIVEALNRHLVVVGDSIAAKKAEELEKAAVIADSTYKADREILTAGLKVWGPYTDSVKKIEPLQKKLDSTKEAYKAAAKKVSEDSAAILTGVKAAAKAYIAANKGFRVAVNDYFKHTEYRDGDTADFVAALQALGKAQAEFLGKQDSLEMFALKQTKDGGYQVVREPLPISVLVKEGFVEKKVDKKGTTSLYGGTGYGNLVGIKDEAYYDKNENASYDPIRRVVETVAANFKPDQALEDGDVAMNLEGFTYDNQSPVAYKEVKDKDTIKWAMDYAKGCADVIDYKKDTAALAKAVNDTAAAHNAVEGYKGVEKAKEAYAQIYRSFFGSKHDAEVVYKPVEFTWTDSTFFSPSKCIKFKFNAEGSEKDSIIANNALVIALEGVDKPNKYSEDPKSVNSSKIFRDSTFTEFAASIRARQLADEAKNYEFLEDQLKNINTQVAAIKADVAAKVAEVKEANAKYNAAKIELCGADKKGNPLDIQNDLTKVAVEKGAWVLGGKQLEWANEVAPEYPELVKAKDAKVKKLTESEEAIEELNKALNEVAVEVAKFVDTEHVTDWTWTVNQIIARVDKRIARIEKDIEIHEGEIARYAKAVARCEAGYSEAEVKLEFCEGSLAAWVNLLEQAEFELAIAKKAYDEVVAKYGVAE